MQEVKIENYKYHSIINYEPGLNIVWDRGKEFFSYEVTKSLAEKSRKSDKDAYEVIIYAETGNWPSEESEDSDELFRDAIRKHPKLILINPELKQKLFSKEEYEHLVKIAKEEQEKQNEQKKDN